MSQSCFSLGFLSQNSLWKLSTIHGYKGYLYWWVFGMRKVSFSQTKLFGDLALRLDWVASLSHELTTWTDWKFCLVVLQLMWLFNSPACFTRVPPLPTCQLRDPVARPCWVHTLELFFILSYTLPLHDSHLNTRFLNAELIANWHKINPTKWLINFNLTSTIKIRGKLLD